MGYTYRFNLEYKPYRKHESGQPVDDVCNRLADIVFNQRNVSFLYIAQEIAKSAAYFKSDCWNTYFKTTDKNQKLSSKNAYAIESNLILYYYDIIRENSSTIVQNAVIDYVNNMIFYSNIEYSHDEIENFIISYIDTLEVYVKDNANSFVKNFKAALLNEFRLTIYTPYFQTPSNFFFNTYKQNMKMKVNFVGIVKNILRSFML